jgi:hypothetical protein
MRGHGRRRPAVLARLPRSSEVLVRDRVKFRVGQIVYVAFSQDETEIGFAFPSPSRRRNAPHWWRRGPVRHLAALSLAR